jgi:hypothetical protein
MNIMLTGPKTDDQRVDRLAPVRQYVIALTITSFSYDGSSLPSACTKGLFMSAAPAATLSRVARPLNAAATLPAARAFPAGQRGVSASSQSGHYSVGDILKYLDATEEGD